MSDTEKWREGVDSPAFTCYNDAVVVLQEVTMELKMYYSTAIQPFDDDRNEGYDKVSALLQEVENKGVKCHRIDTSRLSEEEITDAYIHSVVGPTQLKKYRVRQVFGSARHSGWLFGKQVPALVVYRSGSQVPEDVLPHAVGGHIVTIREYLEKLARGHSQG